MLRRHCMHMGGGAGLGGHVPSVVTFAIREYKAERRATIRDGKAKEAAAKKTCREWWRERRRAEVAQGRAVVAAMRARVRWAKAVLKREAAAGGVACVVKPGEEARMVWPVARPASPGEDERFAAESEQARRQLVDDRLRCKRERAAERAAIAATVLGVDGGPGASARGQWAVKRARWERKRELGGEEGREGKWARWLVPVEEHRGGCPGR